MDYRYTYSTGRNRTATDQGGRLFHAVPVTGPKSGGDDFGRALCGYTPGRRSNGWSSANFSTPTCPRCLDKLDKLPRP